MSRFRETNVYAVKKSIKTCDVIIAQKIKFSIMDFFSKSDQIRRTLRICSHLLKKPLMENFVFCAVNVHIIVIKKLVKTKAISNYLIGYSDKAIRPLILIMPKMSGYVKTFKVKD